MFGEIFLEKNTSVEGMEHSLHPFHACRQEEDTDSRDQAGLSRPGEAFSPQLERWRPWMWGSPHS